MKTARKHWSPDEVLVLEATYANNPTESIALMLGRPLRLVYQKANSLGLKKSAEYAEDLKILSGKTLTAAGAASRFKSGHQTWNKGKKGLCHPGSVPTQFKAGHRGGRAVDIYQPIGAERISKDGYIQRKINNDRPFQQRWRGLHIINWEAINGPLPAGHALVFRDGNKRNCDPENLELVTRAELMLRNSVHNLPPEILAVIHIKKALTRVINRKEKEHEHKNHR